MTRNPIPEAPGYFQGFYGAIDLEPLFDDAHPDYAAGWRAAWECKRLFDEWKARPQ